ncbi:MAG: substrate-binding domain-containing protein [Kiritimatiellia bacterium]|jgi:LacI family transcriptional regulator
MLSAKRQKTRAVRPGLADGAGRKPLRTAIPSTNAFPHARLDPNRPLTVFAMVAQAHKSHRDKLQGIYDRAAKKGWLVEVADDNPFGFSADAPQAIGRCDGVIVDGAAMHPDTDFSRFPVPFVILDPEKPFLGRHPELLHDSASAGRLAAEHLLGFELASYAYVPALPSAEWSIRRGEAFVETVREAGFACEVFPGAPSSNARGARAGADAAREADRRALADWLRRRPLPCGVLVAMDLRAKDVRAACRLARLTVPSDIALVGVDNDSLLCESLTPTLTSVQPGFEAGGRLAVDLLADVIAGKVAQSGETPSLRYGAAQLVERGSTRILPTWCDVRVGRALEFIRIHACSGIRPEDVARVMGVTLRRAQMLFKPLGRTIVACIIAERLAHASLLLASSSLSIAEIAARCAFESPVHMTTLFRRRHGCSMREFRRRHRALSGD